MDYKQQKKAAKEFADQWRGKGYEKGEAQVFWTELLRNVFDVRYASSLINFEEHTSSGGFIDGFIRDPGVIIEQKGSNIDLDKPEMRQGTEVTPFEQALRYAESFKQSQQPRFIITCNFDTFRVYDRDACSRDDLSSRYNEFSLDEFGENPSLLGFITNPENSRSAKEKKASVAAAQNITKLYQGLYEKYINPDSPESQHALNVLCVRVVFCLFCEDAGLFPKDAFLEYLRRVEPKDMRVALKRLFKALDTPIVDRDPYDEDLKSFPYVNGGLFQGEAEIPNFDNDLKYLLLKEVSQDIDWSGISPTIFGAMFESTLNPETRHEGGMHYTSIENIHKVIDPLFMDQLRGEFESICSDAELTERKKLNRLRKLHSRICSLKFLDPACGSGNFLTETYISLRKLEDDILLKLYSGQTMVVWDLDGDEGNEALDRVSLSQLYGIEINDFAVRVAKTALWIAQLQANNESEALLDMSIKDFPLTDSPNIVQGNALRMDWNDLIPADECNYIMGNPPFYGASNLDRTQAKEIKDVTGSGVLDYVAGWYFIASAYAKGHDISIAFVSTNSICQGEQVVELWKEMFDRGFGIEFAHQTFRWSNEATDMAHVHVVIVGMSETPSEKRRLYSYETIDSEPELALVENINGYLLPMEDFFVTSRTKPISDVPASKKGSSPTDDGNLIINTSEELREILDNDPSSEKYIRKYYGADEFLNGLDRWCLWMVDFDPNDLRSMAQIKERLEACREYRASRTRPQTFKARETPWLFVENRQPNTDYLIIPRHSSERRKWIPFGFVTPDVIASDATSVIPNADLYMFGILSSSIHNAWMRVVARRLKSDYRYSVKVVYNNFVWPGPTPEQRKAIEDAAREVLKAREAHPDSTLAEMYDPNDELIYIDLISAHEALDRAVEDAYGVNFNGDEEKMVAHLFKLYAEANDNAN